jgi:glycine/D-amino acid oxidase-like deaminating enzyme
MLQEGDPLAERSGLSAGGNSEGLDLRGGRPVWSLERRPSAQFTGDPPPARTEIAIIGAGITGAFLADRLAREGKRVAVFDRRPPASGSTAASTALLQWEIDAPMIELSTMIGFDGAAAVFQRCHRAVDRLKTFAVALPSVKLNPRQTLYLSGNSLDPAALAAEEDLRKRAGLPSHLIGEKQLGERGIAAVAALVSDGSAEADPVALTNAMLARASANGASLVFPVTVTDYDFDKSGVRLLLDGGHEVEAEAVILATGYEMPPFVPATRHSVVSTWAIATTPQPADRLWPGRPLVWEASDPYAYLRTTESGRIIVGGEDEPLTDAEARDALIPSKRDTLLSKLASLSPGMEPEADAAWAGFFGETDDGLPLIGALPDRPRCYAAFGYGGNGITFSAVASTMIARLLRGERDDMEAYFRIDR